MFGQMPLIKNLKFPNRMWGLQGQHGQEMSFEMHTIMVECASPPNPWVLQSIHSPYLGSICDVLQCPSWMNCSFDTLTSSTQASAWGTWTVTSHMGLDMHSPKFVTRIFRMEALFTNRDYKLMMWVLPSIGDLGLPISHRANMCSPCRLS